MSVPLATSVDLASVVVPRYATGLGHALESHRGLEHHAVGKLVHQGALNLLPWRLARRIRIAAALLQRCTPLGELCLGSQDVGGPLAEVDANAVAGLKQAEAAAHRR